MQRWDPENHDSEERWPVSGLNQDESQEIWFNECLMIIRHFENREGLWDENNHQLRYTSWYIHNLLKGTIHYGGKKRGIVLILSHFVKRSKYIFLATGTHSSIALFFCYNEHIRLSQRVVIVWFFVFNFFNLHQSIFDILYFLGSLKWRGGSPSYCWSCKKKEGPLFL